MIFICLVISATSTAGLFWAVFNELLSSFLYWYKTDRYVTVRWQNAVVAETANRRYNTSVQRIKKKIFSYYDERVSFNDFNDYTLLSSIS